MSNMAKKMQRDLESTGNSQQRVGDFVGTTGVCGKRNWNTHLGPDSEKPSAQGC